MEMSKSKVLTGSSVNMSTEAQISLNERRKIELEKAQAVLKRAQKSMTIRDTSDKENIKEESRASFTNTKTQSPASIINISDLVKDETIKLVLDDNSSLLTACSEKKPKVSSSSRLTDDKISFEPNDFTARSTLYSTNNSKHKNTASRMSIGDILSTSCAPKLREVGERLRRSIATNSSICSFNSNSSMPRTADISSAAETTAATWDGASNFSFHANNTNKFDCIDNAPNLAGKDEDFAPAELMYSQLINDEIAWAQERANMPNTALSEEARKKVGVSNLTDASVSANNASLAFDDPNFSVGRYFNMRSENLSNIVRQMDPHAKDHQPVALVDETLNSMISKHGNSKDSGNATTDSAYLLSLSAVDRALHNFNLQTEDSDTSIMIERLLQQGQLEQSIGSLKNLAEVKETFTIIDSENKENIDPDKKHGSNDTLSFSESLLNNSHTKLLQTTLQSEHNRSALSPLQIQPTQVPAIRVSAESDVEADVDEWPSTPVISPFRRRRRTKSPQQQEQLQQQQQQQKQSANIEEENSTLKKQITTLSPQNLCSTRLESPTSENEREREKAKQEQQTDSPKALANGVAPTRSCSCSSPRTDLYPPCRTVSRCSTNSEFTHREGKVVPIKVTTLELSWPSTKLRTNARKSMQVKNIANKRLAVRLDINGPGFQILNMPASNILTMQSQECRTININFCPTVIGAAYGVLSFYAPTSQHQQATPFLEIPLYGFGGHCRLVPHHVSRGPLGPLFINLGDICDLARPLVKQFILCNTGTLPGFISIAVDTVSLKFRGLYDAFTVTPTQCLIPAGNSIMVCISFQPRREDIKKISKHLTQQVLTLAHLRVISGDEPNRQRMRKLCAGLSVEERNKLQTTSLSQLWHVWPEEKNYSKELKNLREQASTVFDLLTCMKVHEIALTISGDENIDETLDTSSIYYPDADETVLFRTVCAANSPLPTDEGGAANSMHEEDLAEVSEIEGACCEPSWSVNPTLIEFDFFAERRKQRVSLLVRNMYKSRQFFEISCNYKHLLIFTPHEGYVAPEGGQVEVEINSKYHIPPPNLPKQPILIMVYIENEKITVPVRIPTDNYSA